MHIPPGWIVSIPGGTDKEYPMQKRSYITIALGVMLVLLCLVFMFQAAIISPAG